MRWTAILAALILGCGTDVNLGGSPDAGSPDATTEAGPAGAGACEPCEMASECPAPAVCGQFAGDTFCATSCTGDAGCGAGEACRPVITASGERAVACLPNSGKCAPAPGPSTAADAPLDRCGPLVAPSATASCHSCGRFSDDCQRNGCYGGWWCNTTTRRCQRPPTNCP